MSVFRIQLLPETHIHLIIIDAICHTHELITTPMNLPAVSVALFIFRFFSFRPLIIYNLNNLWVLNGNVILAKE